MIKCDSCITNNSAALGVNHLIIGGGEGGRLFRSLYFNFSLNFDNRKQIYRFIASHYFILILLYRHSIFTEIVNSVTWVGGNYILHVPF